MERARNRLCCPPSHGGACEWRLAQLAPTERRAPNTHCASDRTLLPPNASPPPHTHPAACCAGLCCRCSTTAPWCRRRSCSSVAGAGGACVHLGRRARAAVQSRPFQLSPGARNLMLPACAVCALQDCIHEDSAAGAGPWPTGKGGLGPGYLLALLTFLCAHRSVWLPPLKRMGPALRGLTG